MNKKKSESPIAEVKKQHEMQLLGIKGVEGVGIGEDSGNEYLIVYVSDTSDALKKQIPTQLNGYPVKIKFTGEFTAL